MISLPLVLFLLEVNTGLRYTKRPSLFSNVSSKPLALQRDVADRGVDHDGEDKIGGKLPIYRGAATFQNPDLSEFNYKPAVQGSVSVCPEPSFLFSIAALLLTIVGES
jgi:hypothetical protein